MNDHSQTLSIIVPVLNEETALATFLEGLKSQTALPAEVIVADGGSSDGTRQVTEAAGAKWISASRGRGIQMAAGIETATGDHLFLAHADMLLEPDCLEKIGETLARNPQPGGAVGCRFDRSGLFLGLITFLNNTRIRVCGIAFGDQGIFIRRKDLDRIGGFPAIPIMEDVEFSLRLKKHGRPLFLGGGVIVSSRKWRKKSKLGHAFLIIRLVFKYLRLRKRQEVENIDFDWFYKAYYGSGPKT